MKPTTRLPISASNLAFADGADDAYKPPSISAMVSLPSLTVTVVLADGALSTPPSISAGKLALATGGLLLMTPR